MPVRNKTYPITTQAAGASARPLPANPNRVSLMIQNTSGNPGQVRLGDPNQGQVADFTWPAGFLFKWDQADTCPTEAVNLQSAAAVTWVIMEGTKL